MGWGLSNKIALAPQVFQIIQSFCVFMCSVCSWKSESSACVCVCVCEFSELALID